MKTILPAVLSPPFIVRAPSGAKPLFVTVNAKGKLLVYLEVEDHKPLVETHFYVIGVGHHVPDTAGNYIGTGIVPSSVGEEIVLHVYAGEKEFEVVAPEDVCKKFAEERSIGMSRVLGMGYGKDKPE